MFSWFFVLGLYRPCNTSTQWHPTLDWTPVTVHSSLRKSDTLMTYWDNCPRLMRYIDEIFEVEEEVKSFKRQNEALLQFIREVKERSAWCAQSCVHFASCVSICELLMRYACTLMNHVWSACSMVAIGLVKGVPSISSFLKTFWMLCRISMRVSQSVRRSIGRSVDQSTGPSVRWFIGLSVCQSHLHSELCWAHLMPSIRPCLF